MANEIVIGTEACEPGTLAGSVFEAHRDQVPPEQQSLVEVAFKRTGYGVAAGVVENIVASIDDGKYLQVSDGKIVGGDGRGGGEAPADATYVVATSNGDLTAERVATSTATVVVDSSVAGQMRWSVPNATTTGKGVVELATDGETSSGVAVQGNDARLSDARTPIPTAGADTTALHDNVAGEIAAIALKAAPTKNDLLVIEDSQAANAKKRMTLGTFPALAGIDASAFHNNVAGEFGALTNKAAPTTSDVLVIEDAAAAGAKKKITVGALPFVAVSKVSFTQAVSAGVAFEIARVTIPEGWAGRLKYQWAFWGGTAASPICGYTNDGVLNVTRATGGAPVVEDTSAVSNARGTTYSLSTAVSGNDVVWSVTISVTTTVSVSGETIQTGGLL